MLNLPTAILIAGLLVAGGFASLGYFAYKIVLAIVIAKVAATADDAAMLHKAFTKGKPKTKAEKVVAEMPDIELGAFSENAEIMAKLRAHQTVKQPVWEGNRAPEPEEQQPDYVPSVQEPSPDPY